MSVDTRGMECVEVGYTRQFLPASPSVTPPTTRTHPSSRHWAGPRWQKPTVRCTFVFVMHRQIGFNRVPMGSPLPRACQTCSSAFWSLTNDMFVAERSPASLTATRMVFCGCPMDRKQNTDPNTMPTCRESMVPRSSWAGEKAAMHFDPNVRCQQWLLTISRNGLSWAAEAPLCRSSSKPLYKFIT